MIELGYQFHFVFSRAPSSIIRYKSDDRTWLSISFCIFSSTSRLFSSILFFNPE